MVDPGGKCRNAEYCLIIRLTLLAPYQSKSRAEELITENILFSAGG